jgi:hypothetical protein
LVFAMSRTALGPSRTLTTAEDCLREARTLPVAVCGHPDTFGEIGKRLMALESRLKAKPQGKEGARNLA